MGIITGIVGAAGGLGGFFLPSVLGAAKDATGTYAIGLIAVRRGVRWSGTFVLLELGTRWSVALAVAGASSSRGSSVIANASRPASAGRPPEADVRLKPDATAAWPVGSPMWRSLNGERVALLEARMSVELAAMVERFGGVPYSVPAVRETPLEQPEDVGAFVDALCAGRFAIVVFMTGVGVDGAAARSRAAGHGSTRCSRRCARRSRSAAVPSLSRSCAATTSRSTSPRPSRTRPPSCFRRSTPSASQGKTVALPALRRAERNGRRRLARARRGRRAKSASTNGGCPTMSRRSSGSWTRSSTAASTPSPSRARFRCRHLFQVADTARQEPRADRRPQPQGRRRRRRSGVRGRAAIVRRHSARSARRIPRWAR